MDLIVRTLNARACAGRAWIGRRSFACVVGRTGQLARKREGDGASPIGAWGVESVFYRADRVPCPRTALPCRAIRPHDGWCDAASDRNYNRLVRHPYPASAEHLWRDDALYDVIVVLGHNRRPRSRGFGSAVFLHIAPPAVGGRVAGTAGCLGLGLDDLRQVLAVLTPRCRVVFVG